MKVFMDTAADFRDVKVVAIGAVDSARQVIEYDPEMRNRVAEIAVPLMTEKELDELLRKGESLLRIRLGNIKNELAKYSSGLAAVCHQLGLNICFAAGVEETCTDIVVIESAQFRKALERYLNDASDTLKAVFELAMKQQRMRSFDNSRLILRALAGLGDSGGTHAEILKVVREIEAKYPASNLTAYLRELQSSKRGEILRFNPGSGKYFFSDPLYLAYSQCLLVPPKGRGQITLRLMDFDFDISQLTKAGEVYIQMKHFVSPTKTTKTKDNKDNIVDAEFIDVDDKDSS